MIFIDIHEKVFLNRIRYVFGHIFFVLGLKYEWCDSKNHSPHESSDILIVYARDSSFNESCMSFNNVIYIKNSGKLFCSDYLKEGSLIKETKTCKVDNHNIISLYSDEENLYVNRLKRNAEQTITTDIDIISDIFFMLTRYEEIVNSAADKKDSFDRFPLWESLAYKKSFFHRPIVDEHIELIWSWIDELNLGYKRKKWWGDKQFALCLSHDVDHLIKYKNLKSLFTSTASLLLKHRNIKVAVNNLPTYLCSKKDYRKDPFWTFEHILELEKRYGFKSSFYFMSLDKLESEDNYDIQDNKLSFLIKYVEDEGFEAGYHSGLETCTSLNKMEEEKNRLDELIAAKSYGCRQHYLKFKVPFTWENQEKAGLLYDTTLGYSERPGFRAGTCFPYKPYDLVQDKVLDIWEIPLIVMEASFKSFDCTPAEALQETIRYINIVKKFGGVFTLLWHNSSFDYNWIGWNQVYEDIMKYLGKSSCLGESGRNIIDLINS